MVRATPSGLPTATRPRALLTPARRLADWSLWPLTFEGAGNAVWSPDGKRLAVFVNAGPTKGGLVTVADDGTGSQEPVKMADGRQNPASWAAGVNGLALLEQGTPSNPSRVWVVPMQGDGKPMPFLESRFGL